MYVCLSFKNLSPLTQVLVFGDVYQPELLLYYESQSLCTTVVTTKLDYMNPKLTRSFECFGVIEDDLNVHLFGKKNLNSVLLCFVC